MKSLKNLVITVFAVLLFLIGLLALIFELFTLIDPEKIAMSQHPTFIVTAISGFVCSWLLWKLSRQKETN